jgi:acyl carrier protein
MLGLEDKFDIEFPDQFLNRKSFASISAIEQTITTILKDNEAA